MKTPASKSGANASAPGTISPSPSLPAAITLGSTPGATGENTSPITTDDQPTGEPLLLTYEPPRRKIQCNPSAGEVHRRESGAPWRVDMDKKIRAANAKAKDEQLEKRRWGLAKQIQGGLMHTYGMNYGVAELSTLLKTGVTVKSQQQQQGELASHDVAFVQLLAAAEKYDLKQVVMLLDKFPKGRGAGSAKHK